MDLVLFDFDGIIIIGDIYMLFLSYISLVVFWCWVWWWLLWLWLGYKFGFVLGIVVWC